MFADPSSRSAQLYERACKVMVSGNTRATVFSSPYQIYAASALGCRIYDIDGVERIDFQNNYSVLIHGHAHPAIVESVEEQLGKGFCYGLASESEISLAELLCSPVPSFECIRFVNSGTEAVITAIRAARAYTGRPKIAKIEGGYNGAYDFVDISIRSAPHDWSDGSNAPTGVPESRGIPDCVLSNVVVIPFNDPVTAVRILEQHKEELAAVVVDPLPPRVGLIPATREFLEALRDFTQSSGSVLIYDEIVSFRLGYQGAQVELGVEPDLTTIGKFVGGGFPFGAVAGKKEVMAVFDLRGAGAPLIWHGGTFNANPITMSAGLTTMQMLTPEAFMRLASLGQQARERITEEFRAAGIPGQATGLGSLFRIHFTDRRFTNYGDFYPLPVEKKRMEWLVRYFLNHGILVSNIALGAISTVMGEAEIQQLVDTLSAALQEMKREHTMET
ncbi:MAG: aspartate aminotransferase family protein [Candidatus Poribacteria bacterium]|nr:aspartate aminotransferase family protein [Candidatus Poribacteria bacterium]